MVFNWKITTPPRVDRVDGVELAIPGVECEFETGSGTEAIGVFEAEDAAFTKIFGFSLMTRVDFGVVNEGQSQKNREALPPPAGDKPAARRGRPPKAAPEAVAPDPIPVDPSTAAAAPGGLAAAAPSSAPQSAPPIPAAPLPPPPLDTTPGSNGVPAFLDRTGAAAAAPPPPPPLPTVTAPPIAAAAPPPPVGVLGPKVVAALDEHKKKGTDGGQALADWLADTGLTIKGASYDDACRAVLMISDAKITAAGILQPLGIAA